MEELGSHQVDEPSSLQDAHDSKLSSLVVCGAIIGGVVIFGGELVGNVHELSVGEAVILQNLLFCLCVRVCVCGRVYVSVRQDVTDERKEPVNHELMIAC